MDLKEYFDEVQGLGVLSTADDRGKVDAAVYARPHFMDDGSIAFIMREKLTHLNLEKNPYAVYLFKENGDRYVGKRLYLKKIGESDDEALIAQVRRKSSHTNSAVEMDSERMFLVLFDIEKVLPLIGSA